MEIRTGSCREPALLRYKAAAINCEPVLFEKERNIAKQLELAAEAAENGAKLIALPEMATTGYCWYDRSEVAPFVEPIPGPTTERFGELARRYGCWLVVGMPEVDAATGIYYNSAVLIGPDGVAGVHRKSHPYISEPKWAGQGNLDHMVFETPIGNIAMLICMDIHFIETARIQGLRNADVIVHISNWLAEKTPAPYWITRAFENGCYVLESNRCGLERTVRFSGGSTLIDPDGMICGYADDGDGILYGEINILKAREKRFEEGGNKYTERRMEAYMDIVSDPYLWNPLDFFRLYGYDPLPEGKPSRIAVAQLRSVAGNVGANMDMIREQTALAARQGSELIVFPELAITGLVDPATAALVAERTEGPLVDRLIDLSMEHRIYIVAGMIERDGDKLYNTAVLTGPDGLAGKYRKLHLSGPDDGWASPGDLGFVHVNTPVGRIGLMIGHDALFPESGRLLALRGADLICCPSAVCSPKPYGLPGTGVRHNYPIPRGYHTMHWHLWRVRGGENNCYMAFANQVGECADGKSFIGRSGIFGPDTFAFPRHEIILSESEQALGVCDIDTSNPAGVVYPTNVVRRKDLVSMRQPLWYNTLVDADPPVLKLFRG